MRPLPPSCRWPSHELRQPTGVVRGYLRTLDQDPTLNQRVRKISGEATRAADRLVELLDEIGELAKLKEGSVRLNLKSMSLRSVLNQAVQAAALPASHDVELDVVAPVDVRMRVDEARLRTAIGTLIYVLARAQTGAATIDLRLIENDGLHVDPGHAAHAWPREDRRSSRLTCHARRQRPAVADCRRHHPGAWRQAARALGRRTLVGVRGEAIT